LLTILKPERLANLYPNAIELYGQFICSDHCPIILATKLQNEKQNAFLFRFQNLWNNFQATQTIVNRNWKSNITGTHMFKIMRKLKIIKYELKEWSKNHFGRFYDKLYLNAQKIDYVDEKLLSDPNTYRPNS